MNPPDITSYKDLEAYLRHWTNFAGEQTHFDYNGLLHLALAILENLKENGLDSEIEEYAASISDEHAAYMRILLSKRKGAPVSEASEG